MDDPNITMEEYIRLEEEKAQRHGRTFNWQTTTYGKVNYCEDEDDSFTNFKTEYPSIVFDDTLTSDAALSCEPTVSPLNENEIDFRISFDESDDEDYMVIFDKNSFSYKIIYVDNLKMDSENENDKVNMPSSSSPEPTTPLNLVKNLYVPFGIPSDPKRYYKDGVYTRILQRPWRHLYTISTYCLKRRIEQFPIRHMAPLPPRDQIHPWLRSVNRVHVLDFAGLTKEMRPTLAGRLRMVYTRDKGHELFTSHAWRRLFEIRAPLVREFILEFLSTCKMSNTEMGLDIADTLCFQLGGARRILAGESVDRGTANVPYLLAHYPFRHAEGRKSRTRLSGGYFIWRLAEGLRGLSVVTHELPLIDLHELSRLNIYERIGDTWAWIAPRPERQPNAAAGAPKGAEDAPAVDEGAQADPAPVQAPQPSPPAPRTMP
ncbi:hypothetical protein Tco_0683506 [Tanacetum coccineum]|uniref:Uncharacterized protein n=1 Tax=Tanacetum coccineum TaxID=301880 RepID=A0ABQ4XVR9_9ASTR